MSIVFQPDNSTIQFGDSQGNIPHNGVLSSNIVGTDVLPPTFPTTSTGTSLGHYHYTEPTTNALKFLNVSGTGSGGHKFYTSNSTTAPVNTATIGLDGLTIDKSTSGNPQTINLSTELQITTGDRTSKLSATNLTGYFNQTNLDLVNNELTLKNPVHDYLNSVLNGYNLVVSDNSSNLKTYIQANNISNDGGTSQTSSSFSSTTLNITDVANNSNSVLTSSDLLFNSVSLKTQVSTNTNNIATINSNIASLPSLIIKQTTTSNQGLSLAIFADGKPAIAPTTTISQQYAFTPSWYFKNTFSSNNKINWYFAGPIGLTVSNLLGVYMNMFSASMTSNDLCPFITIYTQAQSGDSTFYHSKRTYIFNQSITPIINTRYFNFANISGTCPTPQIPAPSNLINMQLSTVSSSNAGPFLPTELILFLTIGSNSAATINTVEFAINKFGFMTSTGSQEINLISS